MVAHARRPYITPEEYLANEVECETKNEYVDGVIVAMSGGTPEHIRVTMNLTGQLYSRLRGDRCTGFATEMRVRLDSLNRYYYPDYVITCQEPRFENIRGVKSLTNPTVIVEVLSESTERRDRGEKWLAYERIESLRAYLLIHQDKPLIEVYSRNAATEVWEYTRVEEIESVLQVPVIDYAIKLADMYEGVEFRL